MVRLKQKYKKERYIDKILSQFHYGSIKTLLNAVNIGEHSGSQFHYGSIKT